MKTTKLALTLAIAFICSFSFTSNAASKEYENAVAKYLEVTNAKETVIVTMEQAYSTMGFQIKNMHQMCVAMVDAIWDDYLVDASNVMSKYYSIDDLKNIIAFYQTPTGVKFAKYSPIIAKECTQFMGDQSYVDKIYKVVQKYVK